MVCLPSMAECVISVVASQLPLNVNFGIQLEPALMHITVCLLGCVRKLLQIPASCCCVACLTFTLL